MGNQGSVPCSGVDAFVILAESLEVSAKQERYMRMNVVVTVRLQSIDCEITINCEITGIVQVREIQMSVMSDIREE